MTRSIRRNDKNVFLFILGTLVLVGIIFLLKTQEDDKKIYLYAWETPQDFSFLTADDYYIENIGVAYLAGEVSSENGEVIFSDRRNPLVIPKGVEMISVVRINPLSNLGELVANKKEIALFIIDHCSRADHCQIDMDTKPSEYDYYGEIIEMVNSELGERVSIAALASWCTKDSWIDSLEISYAVPMLYRMGERSEILKIENISLKNDFCKENVALSTDELDFDFRKYATGKTVFVFNPNTWTDKILNDIMKELK